MKQNAELYMVAGILKELFIYQLLGIDIVCCIFLKFGFTTAAWWEVLFPPSLSDLWFISVCLWAYEGLTAIAL